MNDAQPEQAEQPAPPVIRVLSGQPTPEETAAIVAVLTAAAGGSEPSPAPRRSQWGSHGDVIRRSVRAGHGNWVRSAHPHTSV